VEQFLILLLAGFLAAVLSGTAGFGGALLLLPVLVHVLGPLAAVPVLTLAQLFGNGSRVWFNRHNLQWRPIGYFLFSAVPLSVAGSFLFTQARSEFVQASIGLFLILMVGYRRFKKTSASSRHTHLLLGGALTGFLSGLAGSAGPLGAAFFLSLSLSPTAYLGSEAFTAMIMHLTKSVVYSKYALIGTKELLTGLVVGIGMIAGSYAGKKIAEKLPHRTFVLIVEFLLVLSGLQLLWSAR
jgi:uncharacterized membrane protein YfcA